MFRCLVLLYPLSVCMFIGGKGGQCRPFFGRHRQKHRSEGLEDGGLTSGRTWGNTGGNGGRRSRNLFDHQRVRTTLVRLPGLDVTGSYPVARPNFLVPTRISVCWRAYLAPPIACDLVSPRLHMSLRQRVPTRVYSACKNWGKLRGSCALRVQVARRDSLWGSPRT